MKPETNDGSVECSFVLVMIVIAAVVLGGLWGLAQHVHCSDQQTKIFTDRDECMEYIEGLEPTS